jgi:DNA polymerase-3 subunit chi
MTRVIFHLCAEQADDKDNLSYLQLACQQAALYYRQQKSVFIFTDSKELAHEIDELLWQFEPESFVPHNLPGEGPSGGAPVEISWQAPGRSRQVLINLSQRIPQFANRFAEIIDFVPEDEQLKQAARQRYKLYRSYGLTVDTQQVAGSN